MTSTGIEGRTQGTEPALSMDKSLKARFRYLMLIAALGIVVMESGFDQGCIGGFQAMVGFLKVFGYRDSTVSSGWNIHTVPQQIISSFMVMGSAIGCLSVGMLSAFLGRRSCLALGCVLIIVACVVQATTTHLGGLYVGRLLTGLGNGFLQSFSMIYVQETAPPHLRALSAGFLQSWTPVGAFIGSAIDNATQVIQSRLSYQIPLFVLLAIPTVTLAILPFVPESPRWLLLQGHEELAFRSLRLLRKGASDDAALRYEFNAMKSGIAREQEMRISARHLFQGTNLRRTLTAIGVGMTPVTMGAMFMIQYGVYFFQMAGVLKPFQDTVIVNSIGLFGIYTSFFIIRRVGAKKLLLFGSATGSICMLIIAVIYSTPGGSQHGGTGLVALASVYYFGFNHGSTLYTNLVTGEIPSQSLRAYTMGLGLGIAFILSWLISFTAPYFINPENLNWGPRYCYIWAVSCALDVAFIFFVVPDLSGRRLEEVNILFEAGLPARRFPDYVCVGDDVVERKSDNWKNEFSVEHTEGA